MEECDKRIQTNIIKDRFIERGYPDSLFNKSEREKKEIMDKCTIDPLFITQYSKESLRIKKSIQKHWHIVCGDPVIGSLLPTKPRTIFRKAPNLKDILTNSYIKKNKQTGNSWLKKGKGFFHCGKCKACRETRVGRKGINKYQVDINGHNIKIDSWMSCDTYNVIYLLVCPCGLGYIGRTGRKLKSRLREHCRNIRKKITSHSVSSHFKAKHNSDPSGMRFIICAPLHSCKSLGNYIYDGLVDSDIMG